VKELVERLDRNRIGAMVVTDDGRSIAGMVSERDVVRGLAERGSLILQTPVAELMTRHVVTCSPGDSVKHLMALMTERRVRHLPVVVNGELTGIVSIGDVVKSRLQELETETSVLREAFIGRR
jgi:CBS domain-containing protein